jgi:periplasmic protein CpxP/Spy
MTMNHVSAAVLAVALSLPVAAWAQSTTTAPGTTAAPATTPAPAPTAAAGSAGESRQAMVEQRIADLHATLNITKAQEAEFDKFAQVMLDNAQAMDMLTSKAGADRDSQSAVQVLGTYAEVSQLHAQNVKKLSVAFRPLYASLSPDQKKTADEMFRARAEEHEQKQGAQTPGEQKPAMQKQGG